MRSKHLLAEGITCVWSVPCVKGICAISYLFCQPELLNGTAGNKLNELNNLIKFTELISCGAHLTPEPIILTSSACMETVGSRNPLAFPGRWLRNTAPLQISSARLLWAHWSCRTCVHEQIPTGCASGPLGTMVSPKDCGQSTRILRMSKLRESL